MEAQDLNHLTHDLCDCSVKEQSKRDEDGKHR